MEFNNVDKKIIFIRADGGADIGFGHIMRTLVLADKLKEKYKIYYLCVNSTEYESGIQKIKDSSFDVINILKSNIINDIISSQKKYGAEVLITDSYEIDDEYFNKTKKYFSVTGYIDDLNKYKMNVDFVINQNLNADKLKYDVPEQTKLFLGTKFCMMREEFRKNYKFKSICSKINDVLVTVGGMDNFGLSVNIIDQLKNFNFRIHVVIGAAFSDKVKSDLQKISLERHNVLLHENAVMSELMTKCDVAVSACGSTLYELCAMNVPSVGIIVADNQEETAMNMQKTGAVYEIVYKDNLNILPSLIKRLIRSYELRKDIVNKQKDIININGAELLAENIDGIIESRCV